MRELQRLGVEVAEALACDGEGRGVLIVDKATGEGDLVQLPVHIRKEVEELSRGVRERVPDDVNWSLWFDDKGTKFIMQYEDGTTGTINGGRLYTKRALLFGFLDGMDWDDFRSQSFQQMDAFDAMLSAAQDRPVSIPSSELAAKQYAAQLEALMEEVKRDLPTMKFVLFVVEREAEGVGAVEIAEREGLVHDVANRMTMQDDILAVVESGAPWSFVQVEALKLEAVECLGPISRAKAERRF